eukprot:TRINITY_DN1014_c0_g1_i3.p1 TRINITY_DN1014_c0_g1~~TRINITY_DN1014_c0_g1_i3.p1  ORF type:complete len:124 (+),score=42.00 TRINITY_DN1014_c0_g1_i3:221-592(+)
MSKRAFQRALTVSKPGDIVYIVTVFRPFPFDVPPEFLVNRKAKLQTIHDLMVRSAGKHDLVPVSVMLEDEDEKSSLLVQIQKYDADLVVMGKRNVSSSARKLLMGSVASHLLRHSDRSILFIN